MTNATTTTTTRINFTAGTHAKSGCPVIEGRNEIVIVNPIDRTWTRTRFVLAIDGLLLMVYAKSVEAALDEAVDWVADHAPGILADAQVADIYQDAIARGLDEEDAMTEAEADTTCAGNAGHYLHAWEWSIAAENPTRATLAAIVAG